MISVPVYDMQGAPQAPFEVDENRLGGKVSKALLREAVQMYETNRHVGTKAQLTRGEVSGSTKKMYRQKHTGNARMGQRTTPQRRGGGRAFAAEPRHFAYHLPKKARRNASRSALLARLLDNEVSLVSQIALDAPRTRAVAAMLKAIKVEGRCLLVINGEDDLAWKSSRNIDRLAVRRAGDINAYDLLNADRVVFTRAAFEKVLEALGQ